MNVKLIFGIGFTIASLYLNAQEVPKNTGSKGSKINKKYLKHIQDITNAYQKNVQFAKEHNQKPPDEYYLQDFIATMDPETGTVHNKNYIDLEKKVENGKFRAGKGLKIFNGANNGQANKNITNLWVERGPYDTGGRVRGIMFDPNDPTGKKVWAGGVSGGLWYNNDITNASSEWTLVDAFWSNTTVSCITSDPNNPQIFYVGTGEVETGDFSGLGIWKTTNGGATWQHIFNTESGYASNGVKKGNYNIPAIKVVNNNGVSEVYAGVAGTYFGDAATFVGLNEAGLYKSTDGTNFTLVNSLLTTATRGYDIQDIEVGADNSIWIATRRSSFSNSTSGGRIFKSTDHGATFNNVYNVGNNSARVMVEVSSTNPLKAYALMQGATSSEPIRIAKTTDGGTTWISTNTAGSGITLPNPVDTGQPDNDFTRGQAFYDLVIETDPANDDHVYVGGIDSYKSTDGGATWTQYTKWSNNNVLGSTNISIVHADQHALVFNPKNPNQFVMGNDGGIFFAPDKNNLASTTAVGMRNKRFNVTQFYHGTLNPSASSANENMILGAQDNGTKRLSGAILANNFYNSSEVYGGDGAYTAFDDQDRYHIASYVNNYHIIFNSQGSYYLLATAAQRDAGQFINPLAVDRNLDIAYTNANASSSTSIVLNRISGLASLPLSLVRSQITIATVAAGEFVTDIFVSPYTTASSTLFIGLSSGKLYKVTNANATHSTSTINYNFGGYISDIKLGASENEIMVTVSNFNKTSVFYSTDGGTTWVSKEGNLPDIPVKAIFMNPLDNNEVILGTYYGVWGTSDFQASSPTWALYSDGLGKFKVNHFDYRPSDKTILAVTYGRGAFTTKVTNPALSTSNVQNNLMKNQVYPNPTRGPIHVKFENGKTVDIEIYDASGRLVMTKKNIKSDEEFNIEILGKGDYVLKALQNGTMIHTAVIVRK
ncbi:T9SS type A sorting domain-containing protein [Chryseobacterium phocaeense]|uniref:T9SS type A sorting domain-containing protein n=1 Tax=Chryseobacterium phocaeense TaxID=1816690 RepID=UPI0009BA4620|nr:T9SS type A sorting domain-containing protein [Chryseobacterium phocaeense]